MFPHRRIEDGLLTMPEVSGPGHPAQLLGLRRPDGQPDLPNTIHLKVQRVRGHGQLRAERNSFLACEQPSQAFAGCFSHLLLLLKHPSKVTAAA